MSGELKCRTTVPFCPENFKGGRSSRHADEKGSDHPDEEESLLFEPTTSDPFLEEWQPGQMKKRESGVPVLADER